MRGPQLAPLKPHRPDPGIILHHTEGRRTRIFTRAWREGQDHPTYQDQVWLAVQPFVRHIDSSGSSFVAIAAEKPLWQGWVPTDAIQARVNLVLGPGWAEKRRKGRAAA